MNNFSRADALSALAIIASFTIAMICFSIVRYELSFDTDWSVNNVYRIEEKTSFQQNYRNYETQLNFPVTDSDLRRVIEGRYSAPQVHVTRVAGSRQLVLPDPFGLSNQPKIVKSFYVDDDFSEFLGLKTLEGSVGEAFDDPLGIVLTQTLRQELAGFMGVEVNVGSTITFAGHLPVTVRAVIESPPENSVLNFQALRPYFTFETKTIWKRYKTKANGHRVETGQLSINKNTNVTFVKVSPGLATEIPAFLKARFSSKSTNNSYILQPLQKIYFYGVANLDASYGNLTLVFVIALMGLAVFAVSLFNLKTYQAVSYIDRARAVAIKKQLGWPPSRLLTLIVIRSAALAVLLTIGIGIFILAALYYWQLVTDSSRVIFMLLSPSDGLKLFSLMFGISIATVSLQEISAPLLRPVDSYQHSIGTLSAGSVTASSFVALQFAATLFLMTTVILLALHANQQARFDRGWSKNDIVLVSQPSANKNTQIGAGKRDHILPKLKALEQNGVIESFTSLADDLPGIIPPGKLVTQSANSQNASILPIIDVSPNFFEVLGVKAIFGRIFDPGRLGDSYDRLNRPTANYRVVVSEAAALKMPWVKNPKDLVGENIRISGSDVATVIGIVPNTLVGRTSDEGRALIFRTNIAELKYHMVRTEGEASEIMLLDALKTDKIFKGDLSSDTVHKRLEILNKSTRVLSELIFSLSFASLFVSIIVCYQQYEKLILKSQRDLSIRRALGYTKANIVSHLAIRIALPAVLALFASIVTMTILGVKLAENISMLSPMSIFVISGALATLLMLLAIATIIYFVERLYRSGIMVALNEDL